MTINYIFMKKVSCILNQLKSDKKALFFCLIVFCINGFYLYQNNDDYFIFGYGYGYGLEKIVVIDETPSSIIDLNMFFLRAFSYFVNMILFNFIFLMFYTLFFKISKSVRFETFFIYFINALLMIGILYLYIVMR